jgi:predicted nucleotide-binding protein
MRLGRFPDPRQEKILLFLEEKCHGSGDPIDGLDAPELVEHLSIPEADLSELVSDLEERGYVRTGHADSLNPIGMITITAPGRDLLHELREAEAQRDVSARTRVRLQFLVKLYEATNGSRDKTAAGKHLGAQLGLTQEETDRVIMYLNDEGLARLLARDRTLCITHEGTRKVEAALTEAEASPVPLAGGPRSEVPAGGTSVPETPEVRGLGKEAAMAGDHRKVAVVYGRNTAASSAMFEFLRSLNLVPIEWADAVRATGEAAPYVGQVLDELFKMAQAVVVLLTGDDLAYLLPQYQKPDDPQHETEPTPQPRPNVLFEAGLSFGRRPKRTILVEMGAIRPFSDIGGRHVLRFRGEAQHRDDLRRRLETAGCDVNMQQDWLSAGNFGEALATQQVPSPTPERTAPLDILGGQWDLTYQTAVGQPQTEVARIDSEANYFVEAPPDYHLHGEPKYVLRELRYDPSQNALSYVKAKPDGSETLPETVRVENPDRLRGHSADDPTHTLEYRRRGSL